MTRVVVVGYGMAGARLAGELSRRDRTIDVTVLGGEPHPAYNRILLSSLLAGKVSEVDTRLPAPHGESLRLRLGEPVVSIDRATRTVATAVGSYAYDHLVLATGSTALVPPIDGLSAPGALVFRTLDDCRRILAAAAGARTALVLGGGLLGLEAARGLAARGLAVTVVHGAGHLMERQLDPAAGAVLDGTLRRLGIEVLIDVQATAVLPGGLVLAGGTTLTADLLVVACGVRPEVGLAVDAGLSVGRGIHVDDRLRSSDPAISAIGDCAEFPGSISGLVAPAWAQAQVVADLISGADPLARYRPTPPVTRLKAAGIDLAAMGDSCNGAADAVVYADPVRGRYVKLVIRDDRLAGAITLGDNPSVGALIQYFDRQTPLPADPRPLLLGRPGAGTTDSTHADSPALMPDTAIVCRCNTITKGAITRAWRAGASDAEAAGAGASDAGAAGAGAFDAGAVARAGTGCGGCRDVVDGIVSWLSTQEDGGMSRGAEREFAAGI